MSNNITKHFLEKSINFIEKNLDKEEKPTTKTRSVNNNNIQSNILIEKKYDISILENNIFFSGTINFNSCNDLRNAIIKLNYDNEKQGNISTPIVPNNSPIPQPEPQPEPRAEPKALLEHTSVNTNADTNNRDRINVVQVFPLIEEKQKFSEINLYIKSIGGSLLDTFSLLPFIKNSKTPINTIVEGYAASAGSLISVVGKKKMIQNPGFMLIHQLRSASMGTFNELEDQFNNNKTFMNTAKKIYIENTGGKLTEKKLQELFDSDVYLSAEECKELGLVDEII